MIRVANGVLHAKSVPHSSGVPEEWGTRCISVKKNLHPGRSVYGFSRKETPKDYLGGKSAARSSRAVRICALALSSI